MTVWELIQELKKMPKTARVLLDIDTSTIEEEVDLPSHKAFHICSLKDAHPYVYIKSNLWVEDEEDLSGNEERGYLPSDFPDLK